MSPQIYVCSMNRPVSWYAGSVLFAVAKHCYRALASSSCAVRFKTDRCEGRVTTSWSHATIGALAGPVFHAEIDTGNASVRVTFVVRSTDLDEVLTFLGAPEHADGALPGLPVRLEILETTYGAPTQATLN